MRDAPPAEPDLDRRLAAAAISTALLVATVHQLGHNGTSLAGGNAAVALLGNMIPTDAILLVLITILGGIAGAMLASPMFYLSPLQIGATARTGVGQRTSEVVATVALMEAVLPEGAGRFQTLRLGAPHVRFRHTPSELAIRG